MTTTLVDAEGQPVKITPSDPAERLALAAEKIAASLVDVCGLLALQVKVASRSLKLTEETLEHMRAAERRMADAARIPPPPTSASVERALHDLDQAIENVRSVRDTREERAAYEDPVSASELFERIRERAASEAEEESTETLAAEATRRG